MTLQNTLTKQIDKTIVQNALTNLFCQIALQNDLTNLTLYHVKVVSCYRATVVAWLCDATIPHRHTTSRGHPEAASAGKLESWKQAGKLQAGGELEVCELEKIFTKKLLDKRAGKVYNKCRKRKEV